MTDSTNHANEDLDAGGDHDVPTPIASVRSLPPTPELERIDSGWDQESETSNPKPQVTASGIPASGPSRPPLDSIDEGWDEADVGGATAKGALTRDKKAALGKKDRRKLKREALAHQIERGHENREQRKAEHREQAQQRAAELKAQREASRQQELERKQQKAAKRGSQKKSKPEPKPATLAPTKTTDASLSQPIASMPNRAERRAKSGKVRTSDGAKSAAASVTPKKKPLFGPFAIFIAVIVAASVLSYFAFMM